jgi:hypothetical protein
MGRIKTQYFHYHSNSDNSLLVEAVPLSNRNQGIDVDLVNKDIAFEDGTHEDGYAPKVFIIFANKQILDHFGNSSIGVSCYLILVICLALQEEGEGENML